MKKAKQKKAKMQMKPTSRKAVYPGTFDPMTLGHLDIISRSMGIVDELVIAVACDVIKEPVFSIDERVDMVRNDIKNVIKDKDKIEVIGFKGLLVDFVKANGANIIIRGLRAVSDFEYEFQLFSANNMLDNSIETIFLPAKDPTNFISATIVKEIARLEGDVSNFVSPYVRTQLMDKYSKG